MAKGENLPVVDERAKIYTIFSRLYQKDVDTILDKLQTKCSNVDFVGRDVISQIKPVLEKIRNLKSDLDGMLVFGPYYDRKITSIGLPVIMVNSVLRFGEWKQGISHFYENEKVLTSTLCEHDISPSVASDRSDDLVGKIKLITALKKVKKSRLLNIESGDNTLQACEQKSDKPGDYRKVFFDNLKKIFGLEIKTILWNEFYKEIEKADEKAAEKIADRWINEAKKVKETTKLEIVKVARLCLAAKKLMEQFDCEAFTIRSWSGAWQNVKIMPPLAEMELAKEHKVASCESLIEVLLTQMLVLYITGKPSFVGDTLGIDPIDEVIIHGHCYAPINPHGDDRVPYIIRTHVHNSPSPGIWVEFPLNETVTGAKISLYNKKISVYSGKTVSGRSLYKNFNNIACRSKIVIKTNTKALLKNYDWSTFGIHRVVFYGDFREEIKNLATLIGFKVIEEDK